MWLPVNLSKKSLPVWQASVTLQLLKWVTVCLPPEFPDRARLCNVSARPAVHVWRRERCCSGLYHQNHHRHRYSIDQYVYWCVCVCLCNISAYSAVVQLKQVLLLLTFRTGSDGRNWFLKLFASVCTRTFTLLRCEVFFTKQTPPAAVTVLSFVNHMASEMWWLKLSLCKRSTLSFVCLQYFRFLTEWLLTLVPTLSLLVFQLSESHLSFSDLAHLVFFYSLTRLEPVLLPFYFTWTLVKVKNSTVGVLVRIFPSAELVKQI